MTVTSAAALGVGRRRRSERIGWRRRAGPRHAVGGAATTGTERLVVVAESRERDPGRQEALRRTIRERTGDLLGMPPDEVVVAPPHTVLKTSSGKIRRAASRELYEQGGIGQGRRRV